jgi:hypothetical protein
VSVHLTIARQRTANGVAAANRARSAAGFICPHNGGWLKKYNERARTIMKELEVRFTSQQLTLLKAILDEDKHGKTMEEVMLALFREFAKQQLGREAS